MQKTLRSLAVLASLTLAASAFAQTAAITQQEDRGWQPMRGTTNVGPAVATEAQCIAAIQAQALTRRKTELYKCRHELVKRATYSSAPAPVVCPSTPSPTQAVIQCVSPLIGQWTQTTTFTIGAPPTCTQSAQLSPLTPPNGACTEPTPDPDPEPTGPALFFSQAGANGNTGTQDSPKRDLQGLNPDNLAAGTRLLFRRGDEWTMPQITVYNLNATPSAPLTFGAYGTGNRPRFTIQSTGGNPLFYIGRWNTPGRDGNVTIRGLELVGRNVNESTALQQGWATQNIVVEDTVVRNFGIGMNVGINTTGFTVRNSVIRDNVQHGILGAGINWLIENNTFERNGDARAPGTHGFYFTAHTSEGPNTNLIVRNNTFTNNSQRNGVCSSGNLTVHGGVTGALIEGNTITAQNFAFSCYGISITAGYGTAEFFRQFVVRNNTLRNAGLITWSAAPGIVVPNNSITDTLLRQGNRLLGRALNDSGGADDADGSEVTTPNTLCQRADCP